MIQLEIRKVYEWPFKAQILLLFLVFFAAFYLGYWWDLLPLNRKLGDSRQEEEALKSQLSLVVRKENTLMKELTLLPSLKKEREKWGQKIIHYSDLPDLLKEILKIGAANRIYFNLLDPNEEVKEGIYPHFAIKVIALGNYHQLGSFLSQIANMKWIIEIGDYTLVKETKNDVLGAKLAQEAAAQNLVTAEINLIVYYLPEKNAHEAIKQ